MTFNWWTFLLEAVNFVVLAFVLHRLLYRPLHEAIERRREIVNQQRTAAEKAQAEAETIRQQLEVQLAEMDQQRQQTISQARQQAELERKKILDESEKAAARQQEDFRRALARDRQAMLQKLSGEVISQAVNLAERLLLQAADSTLQTQLERHLLETLTEIPTDQRDRLRHDWQTESQAWLETAAKSEASVQKDFSAALSSLAGRELALNVRIDPELIGGVRLRIGGHLWDASIAGQLDAANISRLPEVSIHV
ncbi:MAG: F0F1 ATP synthase subunit delta [Blastocatellales bacterium]